jgi:hypothetical protein
MLTDLSSHNKVAATNGIWSDAYEDMQSLPVGRVSSQPPKQIRRACGLLIHQRMHVNVLWQHDLCT